VVVAALIDEARRHKKQQLAAELQAYSGDAEPLPAI
jgi:hypothetical protein